jgi:hypothetical protein
VSTPTFATAEGLRLLLLDLAYAGPHAWETSVEAAELMTYTMDKYGALAQKHGLEPSDAAVAAFDAMRTRAVRVADDPWAVVTHAVQLSLIYEARAGGLLCSTAQARKSCGADHHDAERFSDRDSEIANYHPAFHVEDNVDHVDEPPQGDIEEGPTNAYFALDAAVQIFVDLGWLDLTARLGLEYIAARLIRTGNRMSAFESLRRDGHGPALLDIDHSAWLTVLRAVLGNQHPDRVVTAAGRGIFLRLLIGERPDEIGADTDLADAIQSAAPAIKSKAEQDV